MTPDTLRLFVAIDLPPHTRQALNTAMDVLRHDLRGPFRWTAPESLHLTLKFLGDVESNRVALLTKALQEAVAPFTPFGLSLEGPGTFPGRGSPRVVWAGVGGNIEALTHLQAAIESALVAAGETMQDNSFRPHLTLARVRDSLPPAEAAKVRERLQEVHFGDEASFPVRNVHLIHSTLTPNGSIYRTLAEAALRG